jgi:dynamin 1-like protein
MINELTEEVAKGQAVIVNKPIKLTIHSNTCPDLTVIDIPGITKNPIKGKINY